MPLLPTIAARMPRLDRIRRRILPAVAVVGMSLLLSGCITMKIGYEFSADGSGTQTVVMAMDKDAMAMMASAGADATPSASSTPAAAADPFADMKSGKGLPPGSTAADYTDPRTGRTGVIVTTPFKNLDDLRAISNSGGTNSGDKVQVTQDGSKFTFRANFNPQSSSPGAAPGGSSTSTDKETEALLAQIDFDIEYKLVVPGNVVDWGPQTIGTATKRADGMTEVVWRSSKLTNWGDLFVIWDTAG